MTLDELKTLIQNYTQNDETVFVSTINDFIKNAEERLLELVQINVFRKTATGTSTSGNRFLKGPEDYLASFSLAVIDANGDYHYLDKKHPSFIQAYDYDPTQTNLMGRPKYYAEFDAGSNTENEDNTFLLSPTPDVDYTMELNYLYRPPSLTVNTSGTYLSENARNALLYGTLVEAYIFMKGEPTLQQEYEKRFAEEISRQKNLFEGRDRRDEYRFDSLRIEVT